MAEGFVPQYLNADPRTGPVEFKLKRHDLDNRDPGLVLKGRVLDEDGKPVAGAVVEPFGFRKGNTGQFGALKGFDPLALTNADGHFRIGVPESDLEVHVRLNAPQMAPANVGQLIPGPKGNEVRLERGVTITGRLVKNGKSLAGVAVGVVQADRGATEFVGEFQAATDGDGNFAIPNVPSHNAVFVYGIMSSLQAYGAVDLRQIKTGKSGTVAEVGVLEVKPGHRLTGQVVLSDGKPVPANTRVLLSRERAWDSQQAVVDKDGRFSFSALPSECYSLSVNLRNYHVSAKNASQDVLNQFCLAGMIREDITGLRFLLEPGPDPERGPSNQELHREYNRRRQAPLQGAPAP